MTFPFDGTGGQGSAVIRGIDIDKLAKGFAVEPNVLKQFARSSKTKAREIRWYQKTAGYLDSTDSTNSTKSLIRNVAPGALPVVVEPEFTRVTSYVRKFFATSPMITIEDIKDSDIDVLGTTVRDVVMAVKRKEDERVYSVLIVATEAAPTVPVPGTTVNTAAAVGAGGWNSPTTGDPIQDLLAGQEAIRGYGYEQKNFVVYLNQAEHKWLLHNLISVKGSSIPNFSSDQAKKAVVMELLNCQFVVSAHASTDSVLMFIPNLAVAWKEFMPVASAVLDEPGIGKTVRCWSEGQALLEHPRAVHVITNTIV